LKLRKVTIKNFRNLVDVTVHIDDKTVVIGENNSGKTAFLDAIVIALSTKRNNLIDAYDFHIDNPDDTPETSSGIIIELWFWEDKSGEWPEDLVQSLNEVIAIDPVEDLQYIGLRLTSKYDQIAGCFITKREFLTIDGQPVGGRGANPRFVSTLLNYIQICYLSALRDSNTEFSSRSQFWGRILRNLKIPIEQQKTLRDELENLNNHLLSADSRIEQVQLSLEKIQDVMPYEIGEKTSIQALPMKPWELLSRARVVIQGHGHNVDFPLNRHGQGIQSLAVIFLFEAYINVFLKPQFEPETKAILALEEPEAHLHPQAIRMLAYLIEKTNSQIIMSSHSPYFIQNIPFGQIRLFRKNGSSSKVYFIARNYKANIPKTKDLNEFCKNNSPKFEFIENTSTLIVKGKISEHEYRDLLTIYSTEKQVQYEITKLYKESQLYLSDQDLSDLDNYVKRIRGDILFARAWLLCEGPSDYLLITYFAELMEKPLDQAGVSVIDFQNNGSSSAFVSLASVFNIPWIMFCDNDAAGKDYISKLKSCGFSDSELSSIARPLPVDGYDMEMYLVDNGFANYYLSILKDMVCPNNANSSITKVIAKQTVNGDRRQIIVKTDGEYEIDILKLNSEKIYLTKTDPDFNRVLNEVIVSEIQKDKVKNAISLIKKLRQNNVTSDCIPEFFVNIIKDVIKKGGEFGE
jgi:putative ATP-dependent endonuclease of OLD family